jgi:hypothetical protein
MVLNYCPHIIPFDEFQLIILNNYKVWKKATDKQWY